MRYIALAQGARQAVNGVALSAPATARPFKDEAEHSQVDASADAEIVLVDAP